MNEFQPMKSSEAMKKWASEPTLLNDYGDKWIKERDNTEENGVSFTQQVTQPSLENVTKQRVQLRPKRRPPSRGFVKSMASLDIDFSLPEEILEEDEEEDSEEELEITNAVAKGPVKPSVASKPSDPNGAWKLPPIDSKILLKKTSSAESKSSVQSEDIPKKIPSVPEDPDSTPAPLQEGKPRRRSKRFKFHLFKFRRSKEIEKDTHSNLPDNNSTSVDSRSRPLGEEPTKGWRRRRRLKSEGERKRLSWLMELFHMKTSTRDSEANDTKTPAVAPLPSNVNINSHDTSDIEKDKTQTNGHVSEIKTENELTDADALNYDENDENPETVSDLKKKFERISTGF